MAQKGISKSVLGRLPVYLGYLKSLPPSAPCNISATTLAAALSMGEVQVRKDLATVSTAGRPKIGYLVSGLITELESFLGYDDVNDAVIVGAGKLGKALLDYSGFNQYGLNIIAAFDIRDELVGKTEGEKSIFSLTKFHDLCSRLKIRIGIITVPADCAQGVCDLMIENGILAVWNFAPVHLVVPGNILVQNENMAASLALLSSHLSDQINKDQ
ncbi:MAG: redox-sensing transcriptional repressor Rex [Acetanaerobacterium sp.]